MLSTNEIEFEVQGTADGTPRKGESVVTLGAQSVGAFGNASHATVSAVLTDRLDAPHREMLGVLARVARPIKGRTPENGVDEILRRAIGVDKYRDRKGAEASQPMKVRVAPVRFERGPWRSFTSLLRRSLLVGKSQNYVYLRVKKSGLYTAERDAGLVDALTLRLLGLESGGFAWLQAVSVGEQKVYELRLKLIERPEELAASRAKLEGEDIRPDRAASAGNLDGEWESSHPNPRRLLGGTYDIPEIYVDADVRSRLGVRNQQLAAIRARASITHLVMEEARNVLLVIALAAAGVSVTDLRTSSVWVGFALLLVVTGGLSGFRIRHRVSLSSR